jgi:hypothetical protein
MRKTRLATATMCLLCTLGATVLISEAATIFAGAIATPCLGLGMNQRCT